MTPAVIAVTITLLLALQPITTDLYLPTLPTIQRDLGASLSATQLTLTLGVGAFSVLLAAVAWTIVQREGDPASLPVAPLATAPIR